MPDNKFKFSSRKNKDSLVITLEGRFDFTAWASNNKQLESLLAGSDKILIDASRLNYLSSGGLGFLINIYQHASKTGGNVKIAGLKQSLYDILIKTGYDKLFEFIDSIE
ncbi:MAG: STAS domain-containing protein [Spirochaetes bacterium]|jgi:anti-sigma B factor antagonist|nr:STAS domain-containing protein [Spirochaetota bacterium]